MKSASQLALRAVTPRVERHSYSAVALDAMASPDASLQHSSGSGRRALRPVTARVSCGVLLGACASLEGHCGYSSVGSNEPPSVFRRLYRARLQATATCPSGTEGAPVTRWGDGESHESQEDANALATEAALEAATAALVCTPVPVDPEPYEADAINDYISDIDGDDAGNIFIVGAFTSVGGLPRIGVAKLDRDGRVDPVFATVDAATGADGQTLSCGYGKNGTLHVQPWSTEPFGWDFSGYKGWRYGNTLISGTRASPGPTTKASRHDAVTGAKSPEFIVEYNIARMRVLRQSGGAMFAVSGFGLNRADATYGLRNLGVPAARLGRLYPLASFTVPSIGASVQLQLTSGSTDAGWAGKRVAIDWYKTSDSAAQYLGLYEVETVDDATHFTVQRLTDPPGCHPMAAGTVTGAITGGGGSGVAFCFDGWMPYELFTVVGGGTGTMAAPRDFISVRGGLSDTMRYCSVPGYYAGVPQAADVGEMEACERLLVADGQYGGAPWDNTKSLNRPHLVAVKSASQFAAAEYDFVNAANATLLGKPSSTVNNWPDWTGGRCLYSSPDGRVGVICAKGGRMNNGTGPDVLNRYFDVFEVDGAGKGSLRTSFVNPTLTTIGLAQVFCLGVDNEGRVYFTGYVTAISGVPVCPLQLYRLRADGALDTTFATYEWLGNYGSWRHQLGAAPQTWSPAFTDRNSTARNPVTYADVLTRIFCAWIDEENEHIYVAGAFSEYRRQRAERIVRFRLDSGLRG